MLGPLLLPGALAVRPGGRHLERVSQALEVAPGVAGVLIGASMAAGAGAGY